MEQEPTITDLISKLIETYDTKILDDPKITPELRYALYIQALSREDIIERRVLFELINNHMHKKPTPEPDFIGGPFTLTCHWNKSYNKMIYIFGENHFMETDCEIFKDPIGKVMKFEEFLLEFLQNSAKFIDCFLEVNRMEMKSKAYNQLYTGAGSSRTLSELFATFKLCIEPEKRNDITCRLSRMHYVDVRLTAENYADNVDAMYYINHIIQLHELAYKVIYDQFLIDEKIDPMKANEDYNTRIELLSNKTSNMIRYIILHTTTSTNTEITSNPNPFETHDASMVNDTSIDGSMVDDSFEGMLKFLNKEFPGDGLMVDSSYQKPLDLPQSPKSNDDFDLLLEQMLKNSTMPNDDPLIYSPTIDIESYLEHIYDQFFFTIAPQYSSKHNQNADDYTKILNILRSQDPVNIYNFWIKLIYEHPYVKKELEHLVAKEPTIAYQIKTFFDDIISKKINESTQLLYDNIKIMYETADNISFVNSTIIVNQICRDLICNLADIYNMCRVFKVFDIDNKDKSPYEGAIYQDQPRRAHNIIIYAGDFHCEIYRKFLVYMDFKQIAVAQNFNIQAQSCVDVRHFPKPFFSRESIDKYESEQFKYKSDTKSVTNPPRKSTSGIIKKSKPKSPKQKMTNKLS